MPTQRIFQMKSRLFEAFSFGKSVLLAWRYFQKDVVCWEALRSFHVHLFLWRMDTCQPDKIHSNINNGKFMYICMDLFKKSNFHYLSHTTHGGSFQFSLERLMKELEDHWLESIIQQVTCLWTWWWTQTAQVVPVRSSGVKLELYQTCEHHTACWLDYIMMSYNLFSCHSW